MYLFKYVCIYACIYVCIYVLRNVFMYVCMYACTYEYQDQNSFYCYRHLAKKLINLINNLSSFLDSESKKVLLEYNQALKEKLKILEEENLLNNSNKLLKGAKIDSNRVRQILFFTRLPSFFPFFLISLLFSLPFVHCSLLSPFSPCFFTSFLPSFLPSSISFLHS